MAETNKFLVGEFNRTGANEIDIAAVVKDWNHLWHLEQYGSDFTLIKGVRKDSALRRFKTAISAVQAGELIEKLGLGAEKSGIFRKAISWVLLA